jgi:hypothetical protein
MTIYRVILANLLAAAVFLSGVEFGAAAGRPIFPKLPEVRPETTKGPRPERPGPPDNHPPRPAPTLERIFSGIPNSWLMDRRSQFRERIVNEQNPPQDLVYIASEFYGDNPHMAHTILTMDAFAIGLARNDLLHRFDQLDAEAAYAAQSHPLASGSGNGVSPPSPPHRGRFPRKGDRPSNHNREDSSVVVLLAKNCPVGWRSRHATPYPLAGQDELVLTGTFDADVFTVDPASAGDATRLGKRGGAIVSLAQGCVDGAHIRFKWAVPALIVGSDTSENACARANDTASTSVIGRAVPKAICVGMGEALVVEARARTDLPTPSAWPR